MNNKIALMLDDAKKIIAAAEAEARHNDWAVVIAIVKRESNLAIHRKNLGNKL